MLMAADLPLPEHVFVHGFLLMDGEKMSKSLGNVLDPFEIIERFGTDALRYYLLRDVTFGEDGSVSTEAFERRYDTELANELGNLASRTLAMVGRYRDGTVPDVDVDPALAADFDGLAERVAERIDRVELTPALDDIWQRVRRLNRYVEEQAPWQLAKDPERAADLDRVLRTLVEGLRVVTVLLAPWIPGAADKLLAALGAPDLSLAGARFGAGHDRRGRRARAAVPQARSDRQPHAPGLVRAAQRRARRGGRARGRHAASSPSAWTRRRNRTRAAGGGGLPAGLRRASAATPTTPRASTTPTSPTSQALAAHPRCAAIGETGLDYFRDYAPRADQERAFHAQIELARATGKPLVIHTRAAEDDTLATLQGARPRASR